MYYLPMLCIIIIVVDRVSPADHTKVVLCSLQERHEEWKKVKPSRRVAGRILLIDPGVTLCLCGGNGFSWLVGDFIAGLRANGIPKFLYTILFPNGSTISPSGSAAGLRFLIVVVAGEVHQKN